MRFQYRLQKILDLKNNERTQAEWMLSAALSQLHNEKEQLEHLLESKEQLGQILTEASVNCAKIAEIVNIQQYISFVDRQIELKDEEVKIAEHRVNHKKTQLHHKLIDEKIFDKARERAYSVHRSFVQKKEQEQLDDFATMRYNIP